MLPERRVPRRSPCNLTKCDTLPRPMVFLLVLPMRNGVRRTPKVRAHEPLRTRRGCAQRRTLHRRHVGERQQRRAVGNHITPVSFSKPDGRLSRTAQCVGSSMRPLMSNVGRLSLEDERLEARLWLRARSPRGEAVAHFEKRLCLPARKSRPTYPFERRGSERGTINQTRTGRPTQVAQADG